MNETRLLNVLESVLGTSQKKDNNGNVLFYCSKCNHYKKKLSVNINKASSRFGKWSCWICGDTNGTKGRNLFSLFKKFNASSIQKQELKTAIGNTTYSYSEKKEKKEIIKLPDEYIPLWDGKDCLEKRRAFHYLKKRNLTEIDILRYQLGYCPYGDWKNRIIIPSFDQYGMLNYFTTRWVFEEGGIKYKNPPMSKNIIFNEHLINFNGNMDVVLVEGVFDGMAVKRNSIPMLGKKIPEKLHSKLLETKPRIIIYLDIDAFLNAIILGEILMNQGFDVWIVMSLQDDAGGLSLQDNWNLIRKAEKLTQRMVIEMKLKYKINKAI